MLVQESEGTQDRSFYVIVVLFLLKYLKQLCLKGGGCLPQKIFCSKNLIQNDAILGNMCLAIMPQQEKGILDILKHMYFEQRCTVYSDMCLH